MTVPSRRQLLQSLLAGLLSAGTAVLARAVPPSEGSKQTNDRKQPGPEERADRLASESTRKSAEEPTSFLNGAWRNGPLGIGAWRNGGWQNSPFNRGGWLNGGWPNGAWRNGPLGPRGWLNGGWRNW